MLLPNRHGSSNEYRYGYQGSEKDDEIKGEGNSYDFGDRMLDPRIGRWFSTDMKSKEFQSNYNFAMNNPTIFVDPDGKDDYYFDTATKAVYIIKNGEPNRYFSIDYVFEPITESGVVYTGKQVITPRSINSSFIRRIGGTSVYRYALKHATNKEQYKSIYNSLDIVEENAVIYGTLAVPLAIITIAEVGVGVLLEETAEFLFEEATGIPVIIDPVDLIEQAAKKSSKELIEVSIEQTTKKVTEKQSKKTGGRLGSEATRKQNREIADELEKRGWTVTNGAGRGKEEFLAPINQKRVNGRKSTKGSSYPDITAVKDGKTIRINTVDVRASGRMTSREARNAARIRKQRPKDHLLTIPKK